MADMTPVGIVSYGSDPLSEDRGALFAGAKDAVVYWTDGACDDARPNKQGAYFLSDGTPLPIVSRDEAEVVRLRDESEAAFKLMEAQGDADHARHQEARAANREAARLAAIRGASDAEILAEYQRRGLGVARG